MPNWCENRVEIWGEPDEIKAFRKKAFDKDGKFQFKNLIPRPTELDITAGFLGEGTPKQKELEKQQAENIKKYGHKDWYDWNVANWGTKWDVEAYDDDPDCDDNIRLQLNTAWCPPEEVCAHIKANFPDLGVSWFYDEPGMEIAGYID